MSNETPSASTIHIDARDVKAESGGMVNIANQINQHITQLYQPEARVAAVSFFTIPKPPKNFTGRKTVLDDLIERLNHAAEDGQPNLLALFGMGGIGKTALALEAAAQALPAFPDAGLYIDLRGPALARDPALGASQAVTPAEAMRRLIGRFYPGATLPEDPDELAGLYRQTFEKRRVLLVLDNAANAAQVRALLPPAPSAAIITSRQQFTLPGLHAQRLDVLDLPESRLLLGREAPRLADEPEAQLDKLAKVCGQLPLALRVAANLYNDRPDWALSDLMATLQNERSRLAALRAPDQPDLDVEAALNLSYTNLSAELQQRFRALAIFTAPFDKEALFAVWGLEETDLASGEACLAELLRRCLLDYRSKEEGYFLHDLSHLLAQQYLFQHEAEVEQVQDHFALYYLEISNQRNEVFFGGENISVDIDQVWPHLQALWLHLVDKAGWPPISDANIALANFPNLTWSFILLRIPPGERVHYLQTCLQAAHETEDAENEVICQAFLGLTFIEFGETKLALELLRPAITYELPKFAAYKGLFLINTGLIYQSYNDLEKAIACYTQSLELGRSADDPMLTSISLIGLGFVTAARGSTEQGLDLLSEGLKIAEEIDLTVYLIRGLYYLAITCYRQDKERAFSSAERALVIVRSLEMRQWEAMLLSWLGYMHLEFNEPAKTVECLTAAMDIYTQLGPQFMVGELQQQFAYGQRNLGRAYHQLREYEQAIQAYEKALATFPQLHLPAEEAFTLLYLGMTLMQVNRLPEAVQHFDRALAGFVQANNPPGRAEALYQLGMAFIQMEQLQPALTFLQASYSAWKDLDNATWIAKTAYSLGDVFNGLKDHPQALEHFQRSLDLWRSEEDLHGQAACLAGLANTHYLMGDHNHSLEESHKALVIYRQLQDAPAEAICLGNIAAAEHDLGYIDQAIPIYQQALAILDPSGPAERAALYRHKFALALQAANRHPEALTELQTVFPYYQAQKQDASAAKCLTLIGVSHSALQETDKALENFRGAQALYGMLPVSIDTAFCYERTGLAYLAASQPQQAIPQFEAALPIYRQLGHAVGESGMLGDLGVAYAVQGLHHQALGFYLHALAILEHLGDSERIYTHLVNLGNAYQAAGVTNFAQGCFVRAAELAHEAQKKLDEANSLQRLGHLLMQRREFAPAIENLHSAAALFKELVLPKNQADCLMLAGQAYLELHDPDKAKLDFYEALLLCQPAAYPAGEAYCLLGLGKAARGQNQPDQAMLHFQKAAKVYHALADEQNEALCYSYTGEALMATGKPQPALEALQKALPVLEKSPNPQYRGELFNNLGWVLLNLGEHTQAVPHLVRSLELNRQLGNGAGEAAALANLGACHAALGNYQQAAALYRQAAGLFKRLGNPQGEAQQTLNLGWSLQNLGFAHQAIEAFLRSLELARSLGNRQNEAYIQDQLGAAYKSLHDYPAASLNLQQAAGIWLEMNNRFQQGVSLGSLAMVYLDARQFAEAEKTCLDAIAIAHETGNANGEAANLGNLGIIYDQQEKTDLAIETYLRALDFAREIGFRLSQADTLWNLGLVFKKTGQLERCRSFWRESLEIYTQDKHPNAAKVSRNLRDLDLEEAVS